MGMSEHQGFGLRALSLKPLYPNLNPKSRDPKPSGVSPSRANKEGSGRQTLGEDAGQR